MAEHWVDGSCPPCVLPRTPSAVATATAPGGGSGAEEIVYKFPAKCSSRRLVNEVTQRVVDGSARREFCDLAGSKLRASASAARANADEVEPVAAGRETMFRSDAVQRTLEGDLELVGDREVLHLTAAAADEVMVVFGEILCELVAGELIVGDDAAHHPRSLEHGEVAIRGALRQIAAGLE